MIQAIPFLLQRGHEAGFAAFAVGLVGVWQIPGRLLFAPLEDRLSPEASIASVFALVAGGIALTVVAHATPLVLAGLALLGIGSGMTTLARATVGTDDYGTIAGWLAATTTAARAAGPVAAALLASALGYSALLWTLSLLAATAAGLGWLSRRERRTDLVAGRLQTAGTRSPGDRMDSPRRSGRTSAGARDSRSHQRVREPMVPPRGGVLSRPSPSLVVDRNTPTKGAP